MIIHQLICGETRTKGWGVLKTTIPDLTLAESVAFVSNLQDTPGGVSWIPVIRAFYHNDYFLVMKTFPDKSPDVRPGRAFSHVLVIEAEDVNNINDIGSLFKLFTNQIDKSIIVEPINFNPNESQGIQLNNISQERFNKVIHGYVRANQYRNTIIWVGEENFGEAISKFWQILIPTDKKQLNIGINFNVAEVPVGKLNLITTPENIENKFFHGGFCVIRRNDKQILTELSEQILAGDSIATQRIKMFQNTIQAKQLSRTDIDKVAIVIKTLEEINSIADLKKLNTLSHIVAEYSPDENKGLAFKEKLVDKISKLIDESDVTDIPLIKNFKIKSFKGSESKLKLSVANWLVKYLFSVTETRKIKFATLFKQLKESTTANWWTKLIDDRLKTFLAKINSSKAEVVFNWLQSDFEIFQIIQSGIDSSKESENCFISQLPSSFDKSNFVTLKEFAVERSWYKFHSTLLILEYPFEKAISEQLLVDTDLQSFDGIEIITESAKAKSIIDFTILNGDRRLIKISGKLCHEDSSHLERIDFTNVYWQEVWLNSITNGNKVSDGFKEPQVKILKLFDIIVKGISVNETLLEKISETEFANLLKYKERENIWDKLPPTISTKFLSKTASGLLESLSKDSTIEVPTDKTLSEYIIKHAIGDFLYYNRSNIKSTMPIFNKFDKLPEHIFNDYINNYAGRIDIIEATQLGKLVYRRDFRTVASLISKKSTKHNNWKFALAECHCLLDFFAKGWLAISGILDSVNITADQWWESAEDIIVDLFPNGNSITTIWKKAGGKESDLLINATARDIWRDLISKIRNGTFKNITMNSLLKEIKKSYYDTNEKFKLIHDLRKNYIHVN